MASCSFRFCGEMQDPISQQYYLRARYYNPVIGRFIQEDTYRGDGLNLYAYCANSPVNYVDPSGHWCETKQDIYNKLEAEAKDRGEVIDGARKLELMAEAANAAKGKNAGADPVIYLEGGNKEQIINLYHATSTEGANSIYNNGVDLNHATRNMDFGKGFYTTIDIDQAKQWAARHGNDGGVVIEFNIPKIEFDKLNNKVFDSPNQKWENFVRNSRNGMENNYDTISGEMLRNPSKRFKQGKEPAISSGQQTAFNTKTAIDLLNQYIKRK